jgi:hypothetical protein
LARKVLFHSDYCISEVDCFCIINPQKHQIMWVNKARYGLLLAAIVSIWIAPWRLDSQLENLGWKVVEPLKGRMQWKEVRFCGHFLKRKSRIPVPSCLSLLLICHEVNSLAVCLLYHVLSAMVFCLNTVSKAMKLTDHGFTPWELWAKINLSSLQIILGVLSQWQKANTPTMPDLRMLINELGL